MRLNVAVKACTVTGAVIVKEISVIKKRPLALQWKKKGTVHSGQDLTLISFQLVNKSLRNFLLLESCLLQKLLFM